MNILLSLPSTIGLITAIVLISINLVVVFYLLSEKDKKNNEEQ